MNEGIALLFVAEEGDHEGDTAPQHGVGAIDSMRPHWLFKRQNRWLIFLALPRFANLRSREAHF